MTCRVLKLCRSQFYDWLNNPITASELAEAYRANALFDAHRDDLEFGHRLLADEARGVGQAMADRTAWRICRDNGWWSVISKKKAKNGTPPGPAVHDDLVQRDFTAETPNQLWLTDIPPLRASRSIAAGGTPTEHPTAQGGSCTCVRSGASSPGGSWATASTPG